MTTDETLALVLRLLTLVAENEDYGEIDWRTDGQYAPVTFFVNCNDLFYWACADSEPITDLDLLEQSYRDARDTSLNALALYCCRARKMRPQGACYPKDRAAWPLLDACGPEREVGLGNPLKPGERY